MGTLRSWLIRGGILAVLAAALAGAWVAHDWVRPERVRELLIAALKERLPGTEVEVESANLRLFGGIAVRGLKLSRPGEAEPFFDAPVAHLSHDKQALGRGKLELRKVEFDGLVLRVARRADGSWGLPGLAPTSSEALAPLPTILVKNATVFVADESPNAPPPLKLADAKFQLVNDPLPLLRVDGQFTLTPALAQAGGLSVPMSVSLKYHRADKVAQLRVDVPDFPLSADLNPAIARWSPEAADYLAPFTARLGLHVDLRSAPGQPCRYDVKLTVREGRYEDDALPWPLEHLSGSITVKDGKVTVENATGKLGASDVELKLETKPLGESPATWFCATPKPGEAKPNPVKVVEDRLEKASFTVRELPLADELFARLPEQVGNVRRLFNPQGTVDASVTWTRTPAGMRQEYEVRPGKLSMVYAKFKYPVHALGGHVRRVVLPDGTDEFDIKLTGSASGRPVEIAGRVGADGDDPLIAIRITGSDFPIDDKLFAVMPGKYARELTRMRAGGRGDFTVEVNQPAHVNRCESTFKVRLYDGAVNAEQFPYPLTQLKGRLFVRVAASNPDRPLRPGMALGAALDTDRVEIRDFEAAHGAGRVWVSGNEEPIPGSADRRLCLRVQGEHLPFDADLRAAVAALNAGELWDKLAPKGSITFGADVEITERAAAPVSAAGTLGDPPSRLAAATPAPEKPAFQPASDLKLTVRFQGPAVTPTFFPYELTDLAGLVRYGRGKVDVGQLTARHGATSLGLEVAEVRFGESGMVWANLGRTTVTPLVVDATLLAALPPAAREAVDKMRVRGPMHLNAKHLILQVPGKAADAGGVVARAQAADAASQVAPPAAPAGREPILYWNAELTLLGTSFDAGVDWADVKGSIASVGRYDSGQVGRVVGNAWFDTATVGRQPLTNVKLSYRVRPAEWDPTPPGRVLPMALEFPDITATAFQGTVGGEARVTFDEGTRFRLWLTAAGVRIDELAAHWKLGAGAELRGLAQGRILLENPPDPQTGLAVLTGQGQLDVPNGRLLNLPVLLPMLKLLKLQAPDQTAFEEAHATFDIRGPRVRVSQLDLIGSAVSLGGVGELDTRADAVHFEFYTVWSQALRRWLASPLGDVTSLLSGNLFRIEMVKPAGGAYEYRPQMLPIITEPVRNVAERLRNRLGVADPAPAAPPAAVRAAGAR